ncbi:aspartate carbamoyltransferase [Candidatus Gottesmanbacteria bacterium]|nr:aspartate carbamoyltransferase [Candidatus Gottesmanbacteria bacterium]
MKKINGDFFNKSIVSVDQFSKADIEILFELAAEYKKGISNGMVFNDLNGKILTALFYEPSSRTIGSFLGAMQRLGGGIIPIHGILNTSVVKGEILTDTINIFQSYSDVIAIRHPEAGAAEIAAKAAYIPVINAGDGTGEHPTQGLLDLFTILEKLQRTNNLKVAIVGDLKYGRTAHSLSKLISIYPKNTLYFISPPQSPMPDEVVKIVKKNGAVVKTAKSIEEVLKTIDVLYMTRVQKERMEEEVYEKMKNSFILTGKMARAMKKDSLIMHPLPRVGEITMDVDSNPRAMYLKHQMRNGMFIRMALLRLVLKK